MRVIIERDRGGNGCRQVDAIPLGVPAVGVRVGRRPPRVLVAEDDDAMRDLIATVLRRDGYDVIEAGTLDGLGELTDDASRDSIAMIISDLRMPGTTGLELLAALRSAHWSTPFILITAFGSEETHAEAGELGAVAVLDKPFPIELLQKLVRASVE